MPRDALRDAFASRGRSGGTLSWRHELVDVHRVAGLLRGPVPLSATLGGEPGVVGPFISVHRGLRSEPLEAQLEQGAVELHLRIAHLPAGTPWEQAMVWPVVLRGGSVVEVRAGDGPARNGSPGPRRLAGHHDAGSGDYAVVVVDGVEVGVQVDRSGVVLLTWSGQGGRSPRQLSLLTRRGPRAAVELLGVDGLLT